MLSFLDCVLMCQVRNRSMTKKPAFIGGALSFKGDKKGAKKKKANAKHEVGESKKAESPTDLGMETAIKADLTDAERKALKYKLERERKELEQVAKKSHRERVEEFNEKLSNLTELNDIPRVSGLDRRATLVPSDSA
jgi:protein FAM32A